MKNFLSFLLHLHNFSVQLLSEEYSAMSPKTLEAQGLINPTEYEKVVALTKSASPDAHKKIAGQFNLIINIAKHLIETSFSFFHYNGILFDNELQKKHLSYCDY